MSTVQPWDMRLLAAGLVSDVPLLPMPHLSTSGYTRCPPLPTYSSVDAAVRCCCCHCRTLLPQGGIFAGSLHAVTGPDHLAVSPGGCFSPTTCLQVSDMVLSEEERAIKSLIDQALSLLACTCTIVIGQCLRHVCMRHTHMPTHAHVYFVCTSFLAYVLVHVNLHVGACSVDGFGHYLHILTHRRCCR